MPNGGDYYTFKHYEEIYTRTQQIADTWPKAGKSTKVTENKVEAHLYLTHVIDITQQDQSSDHNCKIKKLRLADAK